MKDEDTCVIALLHDVIEDTDVTLEDLREYGFTEVQVAGVESMTREDDEDYFEYIRDVKKNPLAVKVKLEDLKHNSDVSRMIEVTDRDRQRLDKYKKAMEILLSEE